MRVSRDGGASWRAISLGGQNRQAIVGCDGCLFTASGNSGAPGVQYYVSPINNGSQRTVQSAQHLPFGPSRLAADPARHTLYSSNWRGLEAGAPAIANIRRSGELHTGSRDLGDAWKGGPALPTSRPTPTRDRCSPC
jgi:hypothetical protein